jgi:hypothetical protein
MVLTGIKEFPGMSEELRLATIARLAVVHGYLGPRIAQSQWYLVYLLRWRTPEGGQPLASHAHPPLNQS